MNNASVQQRRTAASGKALAYPSACSQVAGAPPHPGGQRALDLGWHRDPSALPMSREALEKSFK